MGSAMNDRDRTALIADARAVADRLDAEGRARDALIIRRLALSRAQSARTNRQLHQDNMALRAELAATRDGGQQPGEAPVTGTGP